MQTCACSHDITDHKHQSVSSQEQTNWWSKTSYSQTLRIMICRGVCRGVDCRLQSVVEPGECVAAKDVKLFLPINTKFVPG